MKCEIRTAVRDVERPEFGTKGELAQWIADDAGVPVEQVQASKRAAAAAAGMEWRATDNVGQVRRKALARLNTTTIGSSSSAPTVKRAEQPAAPVSGVSARVRRLMGGLS